MELSRIVADFPECKRMRQNYPLAHLCQVESSILNGLMVLGWSIISLPEPKGGQKFVQMALVT